MLFRSLGGELLWYAEWDDAPSAIMAHHHPDAHNYRDVTAIDWHNAPRVDVVTAGFPCQPFSHAGLRLGANDERHLWPYIAEGIAVMRPQLVLLENVRGLMSGQGEPDTDEIVALDDRLAHIRRALEVIGRRRRKAIREGATFHIRQHTDDGHRLVVEQRATMARARRARRRLARAVAAVLGGLADIGYDAQWYGFRAADVGAPHGRWRVFIFAWPSDAPSDPRWIGYGDGQAAADAGRVSGQDAAAGRLAAVEGPAGAGGEGPHRDADERLIPTPTASIYKGSSASRREPGAHRFQLDAFVEGGALLPTPQAQDERHSVQNAAARADQGRQIQLTHAVGALLPTPTASDTNGPGVHGHGGNDLRTEIAHLLPTPRASDGEKGGPNQRGSSGDLMLPSAAMLLPTPTTEPTTANGHARNLGGEATGQDWREYGPAIHRWEAVTGRAAPSPTEIGAKGQPRLAPLFVEWMMGLPLGHVTDPAIGITRNEQLKALGNGVVWQQSAAATAALVQDMRAEWAQRRAASA